MQTLPTFTITFLLAIFSFADAALAQTSPLATDRPDQTEGSSIVPVRHFQIEMGGVYEKEGSTKVYTIPSTLLRYGVGKRFELRFAIDQVVTRTDFGKGNDFGTPNFGFKFRLFDEQGVRPDFSLLYHLGVPVPNLGDDGDAGDFSNIFRLAADHTLNENWGLGWNLGIETDGSDWLPIYTLVFGRDLSEQWGIFFETYGDLPKADEDANHNCLFGGTFLPYPNMQFDASIGFGLSDAASDIYIGAGVSVRLPD